MLQHQHDVLNHLGWVLESRWSILSELVQCRLQASALQNTFEGSGCLRRLPTRGEVRRAYCSPSAQQASRVGTADTPPRTAGSAFPGLGAGLVGLEPPRGGPQCVVWCGAYM